MARILLVEDEMLVRELAHEDLVDAGHEVMAAHDGEEAIRILERDDAFDVLFTDIRMPGSVDGWGVAEAARRRTPEIKVIYATGLADADRPMGEGEWRFQKPYKIDAVLKILKESGLTV